MNKKLVCPCSRQIEDVADAIEIVAALQDTLIEIYATRIHARDTMEIQQKRHGIDPDDDHPINDALAQVTAELHTMNILIRASGVMGGTPDTADRSRAAHIYHDGDATTDDASPIIPSDTTKH